MRRPLLLLRAAAVFALALLFYRLSSWPAPLNLDTVRDLLSARDCAVAGTCSSGPYTSVGNLFQGASLIRLAASALRRGLSVSAVEAVIQVFHAASAVLTYEAVRRYLSPRLAPAATVIYVALSPYVLDYPVVFNISMVLLPLAGFQLFFLDLAARGRPASALAAGVCLGFACDGHVLCTLLVPVFVFALSAASPRPLATVPAGLLGLAVDAVVCSFNAWQGNLARLFDSELAEVAGLGLVALLVAAHVARPRLLALDPRARARALLAGSTALGLAAYFATFALIEKAPPMYGANALLGASVGVAALLDLAARALTRDADAWPRAALRLGLALALFAGLHHLRHDHSGPGQWSMREVARVQREVFARWRFADLAAHLQTPTHGLLAGLGAVEPLRPAPAAPPTDDVLLLRVPEGDLPAAPPRDWRVLRFGNGYAAVARPIRPRLDRRRMRACYGPPGAAPWSCVDTDLGSPALRAQLARPSFTDRMFFAVKRANPPDAEFSLERRQASEGCAATFDVALADDPAAGPRVIELLPSKVRWSIARVTGARYRGELPARSVVVEGGAGTVTFVAEVPRGEVIHEMYSAPPVAEMRPDEAELAALVRGLSR